MGSALADSTGGTGGGLATSICDGATFSGRPHRLGVDAHSVNGVTSAAGESFTCKETD